MSHSSAEASHEHHIVSTGHYLATLVKLIVLMVATVLIARVQLPDIPLGFFTITGTVFNQTVALAIAVAKALYVITIFMGVKWVTPLTRMWAMTGFVWFTLIYMIMGDYVTRKYEPLNTWTPNQSGMSRAAHPGTNFQAPDPNSINIHPRE